ncbi:hypothetical protein FH972_025208 [Carpinus fangiana]|uniref:Uncharacterized protein n=1 Tax=Carpinus fangiana TaxID=176857 RepID=A0A5N6L0H5_9ROSI|nr:hypothetical protein FH972_025208 [Carpinus fangiana]
MYTPGRLHLRHPACRPEGRRCSVLRIDGLVDLHALDLRLGFTITHAPGDAKGGLAEHVAIAALQLCFDDFNSPGNGIPQVTADGRICG